MSYAIKWDEAEVKDGVLHVEVCDEDGKHPPVGWNAAFLVAGSRPVSGVAYPHLGTLPWILDQMRRPGEITLSGIESKEMAKKVREHLNAAVRQANKADDDLRAIADQKQQERQVQEQRQAEVDQDLTSVFREGQ